MNAPLVLIALENSAIRRTLRLSLLAEGYAVVEASTGAAALQLGQTENPSLAVLDFSLPDMDGFALQQQLSALVPALPFIAAAGWSQAEDVRLLDGTFLDVLIKPIDPEHLLEIVQRHLHAAPQTSMQGKRVILAEDDPTQRKLAELALQSAGFEVRVAEDGAAALALALDLLPDVIVSDVLMPRMDGFALCRALRSEPRLKQIPIVLMSAHYLEAADRELATRFGASRYVSRTTGFSTVVAAVLDVLDGPNADAVNPPSADAQDEYLRRIAHQLERQATIGVGLARRVSLQASALSVLDTLADSLAQEADPESALADTLARCLDGAGLSVGAILLRDELGGLVLKAYAGARVDIDWAAHHALFESAMQVNGLNIPSSNARAGSTSFLSALGAASALIVPIVARQNILGALLLASNGTDLADKEGEAAVRAARSVSMQLGQALALSRTFSKLALAEQRYRVLFENARDPIAVLSREGVVIEANRRWAELLGISVGDAKGRHVAEFAPDGGRADRELDYQAWLLDVDGPVVPMPFQRTDGSIVHVEISRTMVDVAGEPCVLSIGRDVSDRLRLEEQLRQSQKMDAVGRLAGGVAHDFNNVLSVILSYGELLLDDLKPGEPIRDDINEMVKAGRRAADLTRQLLMFSRQQVIEPKVIDLNEVLASLDKMLQRILGADIDLVTAPNDTLGRIRVDRGSLEQIVMNLVVNARDAMPTGGQLTLETSNVVLDQDYARAHLGMAAGRYVVLAVTDSGCGMDRATQARIFEPFYTTKAAGKGTGLGLSTVFGIAHQAGGSVWVYSELGKGTTFKVYLPRCDAELEPIRAAAALQPLRGEETILLAEDDDQVRLVAKGMLLRNGYRVLEARNAGEAIMHSEGHVGPIHLLLTDVVMPQISGPDLARRLLATRPKMRVLFMSGYTDDSIVRHGVLSSSLAYVQKPLMPSVLLAKLREILGAAAAVPG